MTAKLKPPTSLELYRLAQELCMELEAREGVTDEELDAAIEGFLDGSEEKLDRHRYAIDQFNGTAKQYRAEVQRLNGRARMLEGIATRIKDHAKTVLEARCELMGEADGRKVETPHGIVYLQRREKLVIMDDEQFCELNRNKPWITYKPVIDKRAVLKAIKADPEAAQLASVEQTTSVVFK